MLRTDQLLKCIFAARQSAGVDWEVSSTPDGFKAADKDNTVFAAEFCHALENGELALYYQPKINLANGAVTGVEGLARWRHPEYGLIYPDDFITHVELSNAVMPFNTWVLTEACRQMTIWRQTGTKIAEVSVNISSSYFQTPEFIEIVRDSLSEYDAEPGCFGIELSETAAIKDIGKIWGVLIELLKIGVTISIDDVGADYASVLQLCNAPINVIKIDNSFIEKLPQNETAAAFVRTILDIAASSNVTTLAEGVETKAQLDFLRKYGCNVAQGYLLCPPLPAGCVETFFETYTRELNAAGIDAIKCPRPTKLQQPLPQTTEEILKSSLNHEKLINTIHSIILSDKDTSAAINKALRLLGQYFDACNAYIAETNPRTKRCSITYEWIRPRGKSVVDACEKVMNSVPDYYSLFRAGVFYAGDTAELSEPLASGYSQTGCRSFFQAVIIAGGTIAGHIGFAKSTRKIWSSQEINILKSSANIFSAALSRIQAEREISGHYKQLEVVMEHLDALIAVVDAESYEILFANAKFKQKFQPCKNEYTVKEDHHGNADTAEEPIHGNADTAEKPIHGNADTAEEPIHDNGIYPLPPGKKLSVGETLTEEKYNKRLAAWLKITSTGITWLDSKPAVLQSAVDISTQKNHEMLIAGMAYEDILTGIPNRRAMEEYLEKKFALFLENNERVCIAMVDIDGFKMVNDTHGHDAGDAILKATANLLQTFIRADDKVCRWGGEEFVICFDRVMMPAAMQIAERLRNMIAGNYVSFGGKQLAITVSIGIAEFKAGDAHYSKALYDADKAMYKSKSLGKNQVNCIDREEDKV